jgi:hypothetical protein
MLYVLCDLFAADPVLSSFFFVSTYLVSHVASFCKCQKCEQFAFCKREIFAI